MNRTTPTSGFDSLPNAELQLFWKVYEDHYDEVSDRTEELVAELPEFAPFLDLVPEEEQATQRAESLALLTQAMESAAWEPYAVMLEEQGAAYASLGLTLPSWFTAVSVVRRVVLPLLVDEYGGDLEKLSSAVMGMDGYFDVVLAVIGGSYLLRKESTIASQQQAIRELSTPVLPVRDGLLILPVVGMVDSHRAYQLTQGLLEGIRSQRARVAVIDITGVPSVDSKVANHLIQTVEAAQLMGAQVVLTGLSPSIAQALVTLGVDLGKLKTVGDLQGGLEAAEKILGFHLTRDTDRGV